MELKEIGLEIKKRGSEAPEIDLGLIPRRPGVYLFSDPEGSALYVGKARDLRSRLSSYFRAQGRLSAKTRIMMEKAASLKLTITASEKEALILEAELIAALRPRYNIMLRDDKAYPFLRLGIKNKWPRLHMVRKRRRDGALYFGPYTSARALKQTMRFLSHAFRLRSCSDNVLKSRSRPCLLYQIERCSGPCAGRVSAEEYRRQVESVRLFLQGRATDVIKGLKQEMERAAEALEFEQAAALRDRISAIERTLEAQAVVGPMSMNLDAVGIAGEGQDRMVSVLSVREGRITGHELFAVRTKMGEGLSRVLSLFLRQHYGQVEPPPELVLQQAPEDVDAVAEILTEYRRLFNRRAGALRITVPERGIRRRLLERASENAIQGLSSLKRQEQDWTALSLLLQERLGLCRPPNTVEGVDISTLGGEASVGSLVRFRQGRPEKEGYRHYLFRDITGMDDFSMINRLMSRRLRHGLEPGRKGEPPGLPDLFVIDGGKGQLGAALDALDQLPPGSRKAPVDIVAIAKDRDGSGERIFIPGASQAGASQGLCLDPHDPVLRFLQRVRDEAHRFGIKANRKSRIRLRLRSRLTDIPGIGPRRMSALLSHFGSIERLRQADLQEISGVKGISLALARKIKEHLSKGDRGD